eukprot:GHVQ01024962.1.p2 GENE.GHVQ01024962.1~~GHVQ01024962.1.p2  ORF type:complete len:567 (-),score=45.46 GHVQ01024962.1:2367-4067(-)
MKVVLKRLYELALSRRLSWPSIKRLLYAAGIGLITWPLWGIILRRYLEYRLGKLCLYFTRMYKAQNMPKRVILLRHAESEGNVSCHIYETKPDNEISLTLHGHAQAYQSGGELYALIGEESLKIYCSPYTRAKQTINGLLQGYEDAVKGRFVRASTPGSRGQTRSEKRGGSKQRLDHSLLAVSSGDRNVIMRRSSSLDETDRSSSESPIRRTKRCNKFESIGRSNGGSEDDSAKSVESSNHTYPLLPSMAPSEMTAHSSATGDMRKTPHETTPNSSDGCSDGNFSLLGSPSHSSSSSLQELRNDRQMYRGSCNSTPKRPACRIGNFFRGGLDPEERKLYNLFCSTYDIQEELRLREQETGFGKRLQELRKEMPQRSYHGNLYYRFFGGESGADVYDRVSAFVEKLHRHFLTEQCAQNFLIVSHGATIKVMLMRLLRWTVDEFQIYDNIRNAEIVVLEKTLDCRLRLVMSPRRQVPTPFAASYLLSSNRPAEAMTAEDSLPRRTQSERRNSTAAAASQGGYRWNVEASGGTAFTMFRHIFPASYGNRFETPQTTLSSGLSDPTLSNR